MSVRATISNILNIMLCLSHLVMIATSELVKIPMCQYVYVRK